MSTIIKEARGAGALKVFFDFRGGILTDQSGNDVTLTVPAGAKLNSGGLRAITDPATLSVDLSSVQNLGVFFLLAHAQAGNWKFICEFTSSGSNPGAFNLYQDSTDAVVCTYRGSSGTCQSYATNTRDAAVNFISCQIDRRLSYQSVNIFQRGVQDNHGRIDNNTNDGSGFANSTLSIGTNGSGNGEFLGVIQAFGLVDFSTTQWTGSDQARLYAEIRDGKTI